MKRLNPGCPQTFVAIRKLFRHLEIGVMACHFTQQKKLIGRSFRTQTSLIDIINRAKLIPIINFREGAEFPIRKLLPSNSLPILKTR